MSVLSDICLLMAMFFSVKTMIGDPFTTQKDLFKAQSFIKSIPKLVKFATENYQANHVEVLPA